MWPYEPNLNKNCSYLVYIIVINTMALRLRPHPLIHPPILWVYLKHGLYFHCNVDNSFTTETHKSTNRLELITLQPRVWMKGERSPPLRQHYYYFMALEPWKAALEAADIKEELRGERITWLVTAQLECPQICRVDGWFVSAKIQTLKMSVLDQIWCSTGNRIGVSSFYI